MLALLARHYLIVNPLTVFLYNLVIRKMNALIQVDKYLFHVKINMHTKVYTHKNIIIEDLKITKKILATS